MWPLFVGLQAISNSLHHTIFENNFSTQFSFFWIADSLRILNLIRTYDLIKTKHIIFYRWTYTVKEYDLEVYLITALYRIYAVYIVTRVRDIASDKRTQSLSQV